jgi:hypothetical protein
VQGRYLGRPELVSDTIDLVGFSSAPSSAPVSASAGRPARTSV